MIIYQRYTLQETEQKYLKFKILAVFQMNTPQIETNYAFKCILGILVIYSRI